MLHIPIEQRYRRENRIFYSSGFAIAAGVVSVGAAAGSAAISMSAADRAAKAQGAAGKKLQQQTERATSAYEQNLRRAVRLFNKQQNKLRSQIEAINPNINIPAYNMQNATIEGIEAANRVTENTLKQLEKLVGEKPSDIAQRANQQIQSWQNRLVDQYARVEGAYPILQRAEAGIGEAEQRLGMAEAGLGRAETTLAQQLPQLQRAREIVDTYLTGDIPETTRRQLTRAIAETGGAGFNPATAGRVGGFNVSQAALSENLRQTAEERQRYGLGMVPGITQQTAMIGSQQAGIAGQMGQLGMGRGQLAGQRADIAGRIGQLAGQQAQLGEAARGWQNTAMAWMELGRGFQQPVSQMMEVGLQGRGQDINVAQANIANRFKQLGAIGGINEQMYNVQTGIAQNIYGAQTGQAQQGYQVGQQNIASNLAAQQAIAQGVQGIGSATAGALSGIGSAYGQLAAAQGASTVPTSAGFYKGQIGAANAYNVAPSQLSYQKPIGGFLGLGGQEGGWYYNPGGVYGR